MTKLASIVAFIIATFLAQATAQLPPPVKKVPLGVPLDAQPFNGKWYRVYLEAISWNNAKQRCTTLGGQLAIVPDEPTWIFLRPLTKNACMWLGGTDEKTEGVWEWIDGTPFTFKAWLRGQPDNWWRGSENYLHTRNGGWNDAQRSGKIDGNDHVVGFICEWRDK